IWDAQLSHPFVVGIGSGELPPETFARWVRQDYIYLEAYARVLAYGAAKAGELERMGWYAKLLDFILNTEMDLHRAYAQRFGITPEELEAEPTWPTTQAYTDFLVRHAGTGDMAQLVAALLPCAWGYGYVGEHLAAHYGTPEDARYADWIAMYTSEDYQAAVTWLKDEMDRLAQGCTEAELAELERIFVTSSRYEHRFWEMCYHGESWEATQQDPEDPLAPEALQEVA
ncbi:MAG: thiaminase II, partial [Candidatus Thermoplasmatota archaeon]|nr:thiaminase II [Candidatus Thermoplasmatota archaeon]